MLKSEINLQSIANIKSLELAFKRYKIDGHRDGKEYFALTWFQKSLYDNLENLSNSILEGTYQPQRPLKFFKPKPSGTQRTISILSIKDAIVYQSIINAVATNAFKDLEIVKNFSLGSSLQHITL